MSASNKGIREIPAQNDFQLPLEKMKRDEEFPIQKFETYHADFKSLHTPINWDSQPQKKIAFIQRSDGNVCSTMEYLVFDTASMWRFFRRTQDAFGTSNESFLMILADFPTVIHGLVNPNGYFAERGGYYFLAHRHPNPQAREYYSKVVHGKTVLTF